MNVRATALAFVLGIGIGFFSSWLTTFLYTREFNELRQYAGILEQKLEGSIRRAAAARNRANRLAADLVTATDALERANTRLIAIEDRQREIAELAESGANDLSRTIERGANIRDLLEQSIDIISELQNRIRSEDTRPP